MTRLKGTTLRVLLLVLSRPGRPWSIRELAVAVGLSPRSPNAILQHLNKLASLGLVRRQERLARTVAASCTFQRAA